MPPCFLLHCLGRWLKLAAYGACAAVVCAAVPGGGKIERIRPAGDPAVDSAALQRAINSLVKTGGRLVLQPGVFRLRRGLAINNSKQPVELAAEPGAVLRLEPARVARLAAAAAADAREVQIDGAGGFFAGDRVELWLTDEGKYVERRIRAVSGKTLQLDHPLGAALVAGASVVSTDNAVLVWDSENVTLSGLAIDLQRERQPVVPRNHTLQCGILVNAPYKYATGPASHSRNIVIRDCVVRAATQRGIALYATTDSRVTGCRIENTGAEAIDLDHFCRRIVVEGNTLDRGDLTGIELNDVADSVIRGNRLSGYPVGIKCWHYEPCVMDGHNSGNRIEQNTILASGKHAVWFGRGTHDNVIAGNRHSPGLKQAAIVDLGENNHRQGNEETAVPPPAAK